MELQLTLMVAIHVQQAHNKAEAMQHLAIHAEQV